MSWTDLDLAIFHTINGFSGHYHLLDQIIFFFSVSNLVKTIPFVTVFWVLWFQPQASRPRHELLIAIVPAVILALIVNRGLSTLLPFRARPYITPETGFRAPLIDYDVKANLENWSSFPSDHATYFFAFTTGFWVISRWLGVLFGLFSIWIVLQRVYLGIHYPSDVLIGAIIGISVTAIITYQPIRAVFAAPILKLQQRAPAYFNGLLFLVVFEMGDLFNEIRQIGKGFLVVLRQHGLF